MDKFTPTALMVVIMLAGLWLAQAHAAVAAKVERIDDRTAQVMEDHDRLARMEAQLEYVGKLMILQINDQRAARGEPLVPDEFPKQ